MRFMHASLRVLGGFVVSVSFVFVACGGKTVEDIDAGDASPTPTTTGSSGGDSGPTTIDAGGRICPPNCTIGHACCINGCGGIPAAMPSSCCSCLPNETNSMLCTNSKCGG